MPIYFKFWERAVLVIHSLFISSFGFVFPNNAPWLISNQHLFPYCDFRMRPLWKSYTNFHSFQRATLWKITLMEYPCIKFFPRWPSLLKVMGPDSSLVKNHTEGSLFLKLSIECQLFATSAASLGFRCLKCLQLSRNVCLGRCHQKSLWIVTPRWK